MCLAIQQNSNAASSSSTSAPLPNHSVSTDLPTGNSNDENRRPIIQRVGRAFGRTFSSLRHKFTRTDSNAHRRLENDDTLSSIILDSEVSSLNFDTVAESFCLD